VIERVEIIRGQTRHAELLSQLAARLFEETFHGTCSDDDMAYQLQKTYNLDQVNRELADLNDYFFLIQVDGQVQGYSRLKEGNPPSDVMAGKRSIELKRLYLERQSHGRGLAAKLLQHNLELARSMNYARVYLSVWEHNERAKAFYRKMGFVDTGIDNPFPIGQTPQTDRWLVLDIA
jgi:diamine N-acetyltransferase